MSAVKIASLFAQIGFKVDTKALNTLQVRLVALKTRLNQLTTAVNNSNSAMNGSLRSQILAAKLQSAQASAIAAQYRQQTAASNATAAQARAMAAQARAARASTGSRSNARISTSGVSASMSLGALPGVAGASIIGYQFANSFINANITMDKFRAGLLASTGSAKEAAAQFNWLQNVSEKLGTSFASSRSQFMSFSATASALGYGGNQIRNMYYEIAKGQAALGMSADDAEGMTRALTQMLSKGKVMSEELKGQLAERVPGAVAIMAKAVAGGDIQKLFKMMEDGALDSKEAVWKFLQVMNSSEGMKLAQEEAAKGLQAYFNRAENAWLNMMAAIGEAGGKKILQDVLSNVTDLIKYVTKEGIPALKGMFETLSSWGSTIKSVAMLLWDLRDVITVVAVSLGVMAAAMALVSWWAGGTGLVRVLMVTIPALWSTAAAAWAAAAPFIIMGVAVMAAVAAIAALYLVYQDLSSGNSWIEQQAAAGNYLARVITGARDAFAQLFETIFNFQPPAWLSSWMSAGKDVLSLFTGGDISYTPAATLMQGQANAASGNGANNKNVTIGDIYVKDANEGKNVVSGAVDGNLPFMAAYGNAASPN